MIACLISCPHAVRVSYPQSYEVAKNRPPFSKRCRQEISSSGKFPSQTVIMSGTLQKWYNLLISDSKAIRNHLVDASPESLDLDPTHPYLINGLRCHQSILVG
jgi:hypothetical protein